MSKMDEVPQFAAEYVRSTLPDARMTSLKRDSVMTKSPDIECVFLNAGIQGTYDFTKSETLDLAKFFTEINTNFNSTVALATAFLPYLQKQQNSTGLFLYVLFSEWKEIARI
jgi:short-subunit dehydrogenase involved in D-alanine esterification of teichoic acids